MTAQELREKFIKFFEERGHKVIPSASLVPENDPTVLFTTAGMHPLVPYLMGEKHPAGTRLVNVQPCLRTDDINEIGDTYHHTYFEMLGNWSLGDYWKEDALKWSFEFLTSREWLGISVEKLAVSVFAGDEDAPPDEESFKIWRSLGIPEERITKLPKKNNWWGPAGETGPCGPDTEMFYWSGEGSAPQKFDPENPKWVEIWNDVFMQYNKTAEGKFEPLKQRNVDTGMGLERTLAVLNDLDDNYRTDLFWPIIQKVEHLTSSRYEDDLKVFRCIADHFRASLMLIQAGIFPGKNGREYILRTLLRVIFLDIKYLMQKGDEYRYYEPGINAIRSAVNYQFKDYSGIIEQLFSSASGHAQEVIMKEYKAFLELRISGMKFFENIHNDIVTGEDIFKGKDTFGLGPEAVVKILKEVGGKNIEPNWKDNFDAAYKKHQELSRTASAGMFKGGLADASEETKKLHTAAHLLLAALRKVLGDRVTQKGSNITAERLRFDFSHPDKLTDEQKAEVEKIVNETIEKDLPVTVEEMTLDEAKEAGAMGVFEHKYGDKVKVYTVSDPSTSSGPPFSREICGGPHVTHTGELGTFKIKKEESSSAGIRRIKAVLE